MEITLQIMLEIRLKKYHHMLLTFIYTNLFISRKDWRLFYLSSHEITTLLLLLNNLIFYHTFRFIILNRCAFNSLSNIFCRDKYQLPIELATMAIDRNSFCTLSPPFYPPDPTIDPWSPPSLWAQTLRPTYMLSHKLACNHAVQWCPSESEIVSNMWNMQCYSQRWISSSQACESTGEVLELEKWKKRICWNKKYV